MARDIGIGGALYVNGVDVTYHLGLRQVNITENHDAPEITAMDPAGLYSRARRFIAGLNGGVMSFDGLPDMEHEAIAAKGRAIFDRSTGNTLLYAAGPAVGDLAVFGKALQTSWKPKVVHDGVTALGVDFQFSAASPGLQAGMLLHTPTGSEALDVDEQQTLTYNNAPLYASYALRATGAVETFVFTPATSNSALKAGIEALAAYDGITVTVSGSLTGTSTKSGTLTLTFDPAQDVPQLEVLAGEIQRFVVASGTSGNYTINSCSNFALGDSISSIQTKLRATGGNWASVVADGSSSAPSGAGISVSGAGTAGANGNFTSAGTYNSATKYSNGTYFLWWHTGNARWRITDADPALGSYQNLYQNDGASQNTSSPLNGTQTWNVFGVGDAPGPTLTAGSSTDGAADISLYFPQGVGNISQGSGTGTGVTMSTTRQGAITATDITPATTVAGVGTDAVYNVVDGTVNGTAKADIALDATTATGLIAQLNCLYMEEGESATWDLQHAPDSSGSPGTWADLAEFDEVTAAGTQQVSVAAGTTINPWLRARCTAATGDCVVAIAAARL